MIKRILFLGSTLMTLFLVFVALFTLYLSLVDSELKPFTTDGCSSFPDGTLDQRKLWLNCCTLHDVAYWKGGTYEARRQADHALAQCVAGVGEPHIAKLMLAGVRVGGSPYYPTSYRWGYGWSYFRGYGALSDKELLEVQQQFKKTAQILK